MSTPKFENNTAGLHNKVIKLEFPETLSKTLIRYL